MPRFTLAATIVLLALAAGRALAHPGSGIVITDDGTIYFADVMRETIWKVSPSGKRTALLRNHWTHDLKLGADGSLYYEKEGDSNNAAAPRSLWRMNPGGAPEELIAYTHDFASFAGEPFTVDSHGNVYFAHSKRDHDNKWRAIVRKRTPEGAVTTLAGGLDGPLYQDGKGADATIRIVTAMATGPDGAIYFCDRDHVRRITPDGTVTTIASGLIDRSPVDPPERRGPSTTINRLYGMCVADDETVYVAYHAGRRVIAVSKEGKTSVAYQSPSDWAPLGVAHHNDELYILENPDSGSDDSGPRVRKQCADGSIKTIADVGG